MTPEIGKTFSNFSLKLPDQLQPNDRIVLRGKFTEPVNDTLSVEINLLSGATSAEQIDVTNLAGRMGDFMLFFFLNIPIENFCQVYY